MNADQPATSQPSYDLELARVVAMSLLALLAILSAVALLAPRRDPLVFSVTVGGASEQQPQPGADGSTTTTADSAGRPSPTGSKKDTSLVAGEPVVAQALVTILLLAAGVLGINNTSGLEENLLNIAVPLVPLLGAFFARSRVTPLPRTTPS